MDFISSLFLVVSCFLNTQVPAEASCSAPGVTGIVAGNKIVSLRVRNGFTASFVQDDDGFLVAHMALAHCARGEGMGLSLPQEKITCIEQSQQELSFSDRVSTYEFKPESKSKTTALEKIRTACGFDYIQAWAEARTARNSEPFACEDMKSVIEKAAARSKEYLDEQLDPANLATIDATKSVIDQFKAELKASDAALQAVAALFKSSGTKGEFYRLSETFKDRAQVRAYQVSTEATSDINPALQRPFSEVAALLNITFPDPNAPPRGAVRVGRVRCGGAPLPTVPEALAGLEWRARGPEVRPIGGGQGNSEQGGTR